MTFHCKINGKFLCILCQIIVIAVFIMALQIYQISCFQINILFLIAIITYIFNINHLLFLFALYHIFNNIYSLLKIRI